MRLSRSPENLPLQLRTRPNDRHGSLSILTTVQVFNQQGEAQQLKLFPSHLAPSENDPQLARVSPHRVRLERTRQFECDLALYQSFGATSAWFQGRFPSRAAVMPSRRIL
jgi:hypothetical protein